MLRGINGAQAGVGIGSGPAATGRPKHPLAGSGHPQISDTATPQGLMINTDEDHAAATARAGAGQHAGLVRRGCLLLRFDYEVFAPGCEPKYRPTPAKTPVRIDTS